MVRLLLEDRQRWEEELAAERRRREEDQCKWEEELAAERKRWEEEQAVAPPSH